MKPLFPDRDIGMSPETTLFSSPLGRRIAQALPDRNVRFVFPAQAAANEWARVACTMPGLRAVEPDRFLGWDSFMVLLRASSIPPDRSEATSATRLLWAASLPESLAGGPAFLSWHAKIAPSLIALAAAACTHAASKLPPSLRRYLELHADYSRFLDRHRLYEPSSLLPGSGPKNTRYIVFGPELMPEYDKLAGSSVEASIEVVSAENFAVYLDGAGCPDSRPRLLRFSSLRQKLEWVCAQCAQQLDNGMAPIDIAIGLPEPNEEARAQLFRAAAEYGIPLSWRPGTKLAETSFGKVLKNINIVHAEKRSLSSMRALLENRSIPWKQPSLGTQLIQYGQRYRIFRQHSDAYNADIWEATFRAGPPLSSEVKNYYRNLRQSIDHIYSAHSFEALRAALHAFRDDFLDISNLSPLAADTMRRIMKELEILHAAAKNIFSRTEKIDAYAIFLTGLHNTLYTPRDSKNAIAVYPYAVCAFLPAQALFILESSQTALVFKNNTFPYLSEDTISLLDGEGRGTDLSTMMAASCAASGNTLFCHADIGFSKFSVPHPLFLGWGISGDYLDEDMADIAAHNYSALEMAAWDGTARIEKMFPLQADAAARIIADYKHSDTHDGQAHRASSKKPLRQDTVQAFLAALAPDGTDKTLRFSYSSLKKFVTCPFSWAMDQLLGKVNEKSEETFPATLAGTFAHAAIKTAYSYIAEKKSSASLSKDEIQEIVSRSIEDSIVEMTHKEGPSIQPMARAWQPLLTDRIKRLIEAEAWFGAGDIGEFEVRMLMDMPEYGLQLEGYADRIVMCSRDDSDASNNELKPVYAVVDYKKNETPKKKDFLVTDGKLSDFQIASYVELCAHAGNHVARALYWSIEQAACNVVFGPEGAKTDVAAYEPERKAFLATLAKAAAQVREGEFFITKPSIAACKNCKVLAVCRAHFALEKL